MHYIGVDLGTSAVKLLLVEESGEIVKTVEKTYPIYFDKETYSEQEPQDWMNAVKSGIKELVAGVSKDDVRGIGVAGQMHGLVALDKDDKPLRRAILWNDGRTIKETDFLNGEIGKKKLLELTGNIAFAGFTAPKILWVKNNEPQIFSKIAKIMLPKDYINYCLTGTFCTDFSDAAGMLLVDVKNKKWSREMLEICGLSQERLPQIFESYEKVGHLKKEVAAELGLREDVIVVAGAGDNAGAAIGTGTVSNGASNISLGTSGTLFISSDEFLENVGEGIHNFCHANGKFHIMGCMLSAASCNKWWLEEILKTREYDAEMAAVKEDALGKNHVFYLPYLMGERAPHNDPLCKSAFIGMTMSSTRADLQQAVLEGVAFGIRDSFEIAKAKIGGIKKSMICGGGAKSPLWKKIMANVLNIEIETPVTEQGPGYGAAMLAMVGGEVDSLDGLVKKFIKVRDRVEPTREIAARYDERYAIYQNLYLDLKESFKKM